jgi:hypothetical protein
VNTLQNFTPLFLTACLVCSGAATGCLALHNVFVEAVFDIGELSPIIYVTTKQVTKIT